MWGMNHPLIKIWRERAERERRRAIRYIGTSSVSNHASVTALALDALAKELEDYEDHAKNK